MKTIYNESGEDNGLIISVYKQGNNYVANITNDNICYWIERKLHYSISTKSDVVEWATEYADGEKFELRF